MERIIYLDNCSTTKPFAEIEKIYSDQMQDFYNPSALYSKAISVRNKIENARKHIANLIGGENGTVYFTSGATESDNMALCGVSYSGSKELVVSMGEHPAVFARAKQLEESGVVVHYVPLTEAGKVDEEALKKSINAKTALVSVMLVSNETGAINDIKKLVQEAKKINPKVLFHVDGVQALGKMNIDLMDLGVDMFTMSAHKIHGPKGIGALWVKKGVNLHATIYGGGQEMGLRSGTENPAAILAFEFALEKVTANIESNSKKVAKFKQELLQTLSENNVQFIQNSPEGSPYILNLSISGIRGEVLVHNLEKHNILISTGSACSSKKPDNRTLIEMGRTAKEIQGTIRISFSAYDEYDIKSVGKIIAQEILSLKQQIEG